MRVWYEIETVGRPGRRRVEPAAMTGAEWVRAKLGFEADEIQARLLNGVGRRVLLNCTRQWGKSTVTAARAVMEAERRPGSLTVVVSPTARQSGEFLRKARAFVRRLGYAARRDGDNDISLMLPNGSRMVGLPGKEGTVRGFSAVSLLLIDEAARVTDEMFGAVSPMVAVSDGWIWLMSTPFGRRGFFWESWSKGGPEWERVAVKAEECKRIPAKFLEEARRMQGERRYRQEYQCEFVQEDDALFDRDLVEAAFTEEVDAWDM